MYLCTGSAHFERVIQEEPPSPSHTHFPSFFRHFFLHPPHFPSIPPFPRGVRAVARRRVEHAQCLQQRLISLNREKMGSSFCRDRWILPTPTPEEPTPRQPHRQTFDRRAATLAHADTATAAPSAPQPLADDTMRSEGHLTQSSAAGAAPANLHTRIPDNGLSHASMAESASAHSAAKIHGLDACCGSHIAWTVQPVLFGDTPILHGAGLAAKGNHERLAIAPSVSGG